MKIAIIRTSVNSASITGELYINGDFVCHTLELPYLLNEYSISSIPPGHYQAKLRYDHADKWRIELLQTWPREAIQIHIGNFPKDSKGCILVGMKAIVGENRLESSVEAYKRLREKFELETRPLPYQEETIVEIVYSDNHVQYTNQQIILEYLGHGVWHKTISDTVISLQERERDFQIIDLITTEGEHFQLDISKSTFKNCGSGKIEILQRSSALFWDDFSLGENTYARENEKHLKEVAFMNQAMTLADSLDKEKPEIGIREKLRSVMSKERTSLDMLLDQQHPFKSACSINPRQWQVSLDFMATILSACDGLEKLPTGLEQFSQTARNELQNYKVDIGEARKLFAQTPGKLLTTIMQVEEAVDQSTDQLTRLLSDISSGNISRISTLAASIPANVNKIIDSAHILDGTVITEISPIFTNLESTLGIGFQAMEEISGLYTSLTQLIDRGSIYQEPNRTEINSKRKEIKDVLHEQIAKGISIQSQLNTIGSSATAISNLLSIAGFPHIAEDLLEVTEAATVIGSAINIIATGAITGTGVLGPVGTIAGAALGLFNYFGSRKKRNTTDANKVILEQIQKLGKMVEQLGQHIDERFEKVEEMLVAFGNHFDARFDRIEEILSLVQGQMHERFDRLEEIMNVRFDQIERILEVINQDMLHNFKAIMEELNEFYKAVMHCFILSEENIDKLRKQMIEVNNRLERLTQIDRVAHAEILLQPFYDARHRAFTSFELEPKELYECLRNFAFTADSTAKLESLTGSADDSTAISDALRERPIEFNIRTLASFCQQFSPGIDPPNIANPLIWCAATQAFISCYDNNPGLRYTASVGCWLKELIDSGNQLLDFWQCLRQPTLITKLFEMYMGTFKRFLPTEAKLPDAITKLDIGRVRFLWPLATDSIVSFAYDYSEQQSLAFSSYDNDDCRTLELYSFQENRKLWVIRQGSDIQIFRIYFCNMGRNLVTLEIVDRSTITISLWNVTTGERVAKKPLEIPYSLAKNICVTEIPGNRILITGSVSMFIYSTETLAILEAYHVRAILMLANGCRPLNQSRVNSVVYWDDGRIVCSRMNCYDRPSTPHIEIWKPDSQRGSVDVIRMDSYITFLMKFSPEIVVCGETILRTENSKVGLRFVNVNTKEIVRKIELPATPAYVIRYMCLIGNKIIVFSGNDLSDLDDSYVYPEDGQGCFDYSLGFDVTQVTIINAHTYTIESSCSFDEAIDIYNPTIINGILYCFIEGSTLVKPEKIPEENLNNLEKHRIILQNYLSLAYRYEVDKNQELYRLIKLALTPINLEGTLVNVTQLRAIYQALHQLVKLLCEYIERDESQNYKVTGYPLFDTTFRELDLFRKRLLHDETLAEANKLNCIALLFEHGLFGRLTKNYLIENRHHDAVIQREYDKQYGLVKWRRGPI